MRNVLFVAFLLASAALLVPGTAYAQMPGGLLAQKRVKPVEPAKPATPQVQPQQQPEVPKSQSVVEVKNGKVSVDLVDAGLGNVIGDIAVKLHIGVTISGSVYSKQVSTRFSDLEVERAIQRLLSLANETNYMFHYDASGKLNKIVLYQATPPSSLQKQPAGPARVNRPRFRRGYRRYTPRD